MCMWKKYGTRGSIELKSINHHIPWWRSTRCSECGVRTQVSARAAEISQIPKDTDRLKLVNG